MKGLVIAAPRSGAGKTTVSLGLMRALRNRGLGVQPFKCGPDYIDAALHTAAAGRTCFNLDTWAMHARLLEWIVSQASAYCNPAGAADLAIAEGVMGLFDGAGAEGQCGQGSTADLASRTGWPVVLVLDVAGQTETAAALALGLARYRGDIEIAGAILNRCAGARHLALVRAGFERIGMPVFGAIGRDERMVLEGRHLGLVQAGEMDDLDRRLDGLATVVGAAVDIDALVQAGRPGRATIAPQDQSTRLRMAPPGQRIALAADVAFSFMYPHVLEQWRQAGAQILPFSPLADEPPDPRADAVWLPGGYPELHAGRLAAAGRFKSGLCALAAAGVHVHGECGGYMVLGQGLEDAAGTRHAMAGLLALETSFARRKLHLGYRRARLLASSALGAQASTVLGHEFHYATTTACGDEPLVACLDARGAPIAEAGSRRGSVSGTFFHIIDVVRG